jgi:hypothetical protein
VNLLRRNIPIVSAAITVGSPTNSSSADQHACGLQEHVLQVPGAGL